MKTKKYWVEHIIWEDHSGGTMGWTDIEEVQKNADQEFFIHSVGFVIAENSKRIVMVQNMDHQIMTSHHMVILKRNILKRKKLSFITEKA